MAGAVAWARSVPGTARAGSACSGTGHLSGSPPVLLSGCPQSCRLAAALLQGFRSLGSKPKEHPGPPISRPVHQRERRRGKPLGHQAGHPTHTGAPSHLLPFRWLQLSQHQLNANDRDVSPLPWTEDIWERLYCPPAGGGRAEEHAIINSLHVS